MAAMPTKQSIEDYRQKLEAGAAQQLERPWPECWPQWTSRDLLIHHSHQHALLSAEEAIEQAGADRENDFHSACMIENISSQWAAELGAAWNIPVEFFIQYLKAMDAETSTNTLECGCVPGSPGGLESSKGDGGITIIGVVDYGLQGHNSSFEELSGASIRSSGRTREGRNVQDTRISCFRVHEKLDLLLVDKGPDAQYMFPLNQDPAFPSQTVLRLAFAEWPGYACFPRLRDILDSAVLPFWQLMNDKHTTEALMHCLHHHGLDDFLYRASVVETERHINVALERVRTISLQEIPDGESEIMAELRNIRQALNRLYRCIEENKTHERAFQRGNHSISGNGNHCERNYFHRLADQVRDLAQTVLRDMKVLVMTMNTRDVANSLKLTEATHQQTRSMAILTWLMMVYAPLSFAAGIFGMNLQQLNDSGLPISNFLIVSLSLLGGTAYFALSSGYLVQRARAQRCTVLQLLWPSSALRAFKGWWLCAFDLNKTPTRKGILRQTSMRSDSIDSAAISKLEEGRRIGPELDSQ